MTDHTLTALLVCLLVAYVLLHVFRNIKNRRDFKRDLNIGARKTVEKPGHELQCRHSIHDDGWYSIVSVKREE